MKSAEDFEASLPPLPPLALPLPPPATLRPLPPPPLPGQLAAHMLSSVASEYRYAIPPTLNRPSPRAARLSAMASAYGSNSVEAKALMHKAPKHVHADEATVLSPGGSSRSPKGTAKNKKRPRHAASSGAAAAGMLPSIPQGRNSNVGTS